MGSDAVTLITSDHRALEQLFEQLKAEKGDRRTLVAEIAARLTAHSLAEEQHVYPAVRDAARVDEEAVDHAYHEHAEADHLLNKVRNLVDSPHFETAVDELVASVKHHVEEEESEVLPALRKAVDKATLERLGGAFSKARTEVLRQAGYHAPGATPSAGAPGDDDLTSATRDELYEMAKQADIAGRSTMNKDQLAQALREQQG
jgi:hemerythrin superfamily protein